jgi:hypothetical protein
MQYVLLTISLFLFSCGSSLQIQKSLGTYQFSLSYIHDSKPISEKGRSNVYIEPIELVNTIADTLSVRPKGTFVLPLLFLNIWNYKYECTLGKNVLAENTETFIRNSIAAEANRSGNFTLSSEPSSADYSLNIKITENKCYVPYSQNGFFYFILVAYGYSFSENAGPGTSTVKWIYQLRKKDSTVICDSIIVTKEGSSIRTKAKDYAQLRKDFGNSMAEALSNAYKECIDKTIVTINDKLK